MLKALFVFSTTFPYHLSQSLSLPTSYLSYLSFWFHLENKYMISETVKLDKDGLIWVLQQRLVREEDVGGSRSLGADPKASGFICTMCPLQDDAPCFLGPRVQNHCYNLWSHSIVVLCTSWFCLEALYWCLFACTTLTFTWLSVREHFLYKPFPDPSAPPDSAALATEGHSALTFSLISHLLLMGLRMGTASYRVPWA